MFTAVLNINVKGNPVVTQVSTDTGVWDFSPPGDDLVWVSSTVEATTATLRFGDQWDFRTWSEWEYVPAVFSEVKGGDQVGTAGLVDLLALLVGQFQWVSLVWVGGPQGESLKNSLGSGWLERCGVWLSTTKVGVRSDGFHAVHPFTCPWAVLDCADFDVNSDGLSDHLVRV